MGNPNKVANSLRVLIIADEESLRLMLSTCLNSKGHSIQTASTIEEALARILNQVFDLVFLNARVGARDDLDYLPRLLGGRPWMKVVVMTEYTSIAIAVKAIKQGAIDYLPKPFTPAQALLVAEKVSERRRLESRLDSLEATIGQLDPEADFPTESAEMKRAMELARQVATSNAAVLIRGEAGTGKERLARAMHRWSPRAEFPIHCASCEAASVDELDVELFGMARRDVEPPVDAPGCVELLRGGTLALQDVAHLPWSLQSKILRLLESKEFERHDDFMTRLADVRIIATTTSDLREAVMRREFMAGLLDALGVVQIDLPPLRARRQDIGLLASRYLESLCHDIHRPTLKLSADALRAMRKYPWPGNTRELRNLIERAVILCQDDQILLEHFPPNLLGTATGYHVGDLVPLDTIQDLHIQRVLDATGSIKRAAAVLGIGVSTVVRWMKRSRHFAAPHGPAPHRGKNHHGTETRSPGAAGIQAAPIDFDF